jgi:hypothetical protein
MDDSGKFRASQREIAELANFKGDHKRAGRALALLEGDMRRAKVKESANKRYCDLPPLIEFAGKSRTSQANLYQFTDYVMDDDVDEDTVTNHPINLSLQYVVGLSGTPKNLIPLSDVEQDVFVELGAIRWNIWTHLLYQYEPSKAAIARAVNRHYSTVRRYLDLLIELGFVTFGHAEGLYYGEPKSEEELALIAQRLGSLGYNAKRKRHYQIEREIRVNALLAIKRTQWYSG